MAPTCKRGEVRDGSVLVRDLHVSAVPVAVVPLRVASPRHCLLLQETEQNYNHHTAIANGLQTADIQAENFRTPQNYFFHSQLRKLIKVTKRSQRFLGFSSQGISTCQCKCWRHITGNVEDRYLGSAPCRVLISSDRLTDFIICIVRC